MSAPLFSVLLPSKDRPELLGYALESVRRQRFDDYEVIVSDNASAQPYAPLVAALDDPRYRCVRNEEPVPVTGNWNNALAAAQGQYVVMLGDDDALAPGYFTTMAQTIARFNQPAVVYCCAYHYAYPGVMPSEPEGILAIVRNSPLFIGRYEPYRLPHAEAVDLARKALKFHHHFSFNSQHFCWKREGMGTLTRSGDFFRSPYPDFYSSIMTFLNAGEIVVNPLPQIIIGISPKSFGYYYLNKQEDAGHVFLGSRTDGAGEQNPELFPGSEHNTKWLLAAREVQASMAPEMDLVVGTANYRRLQIVDGVRREVIGGDAEGVRRMSARLRPHEKLFVQGMRAGTRVLKACRPGSQGTLLFRAADRVLDQHFRSVNTRLPIGKHTNILDAIRWLEAGPEPAAPATDPGNPFLSPDQQTLLNRFHDLYYSLMAEGRGVDTIGLKWLGHEMFKCPMDLWLYQELIAHQRPDVVIETGTFRGGSAHYLATLCDLVGHGQVISVDINPWADKPRPQHPRLSYIVGSSTAPEVLAEVHDVVGSRRNVLVILDSDHARDHVLEELRLYQQFIPDGGLLIVEDTNVNGHPTFADHGPGPWEAVAAFLAENPDFIADRSLERFLLTMNPRGYLRRVGEASRRMRR